MAINRNLSILAQGAGSNQTLTLTNAQANALTVGRQGTTNPVLNVDASTASVVTGLNLKGAAAAGGMALSVTSSGTNENLTIDAKGSGTITLNGTATGGVSTPRALTLGVASTTQGSLVLANTSANSTTLQSSNSASAAYTITLPVSAGSNGQVLSTNGSGVTSWVTVSSPEFGTWTPGLSFGGGTTGITYNSRNGTYVKSGRSVVYGIYINLTSKGSSTGLALVTGCPFTSESTNFSKYSYSNTLAGSNLTFTANYVGTVSTYGTGSATTLDIAQVSGSTWAQLSDTAFANNTQLYASVTVITTA